MYTNSIDFALFDYNSINYGGSGKKFDWKILNEIDIKIPFFLSGGISLDNIDELNFLNNNSNLYGIDINSKFEEYPGYKDLKIIKKLFKKLER
jgi:phosphoribosylanthranilate isomerase